MDLGSAVVADEEPLELVQPGEGALNDPADAPESGAVAALAACDLRADAAASELAAVLVVVVAAVGGNTIRTPAWPADLATNRRHTVDERDQLGDVVAVAARQRPRKRDPGRVYEKMMLGAGSGSINRARARRGAPLAECGSGCQGGGGRHRVVGAGVAARGSSLSLVRGRGAGDMMVDGDSRGRAVSGRPVFCGQRVAGARPWHGAFGSRPEGLEGRIDDVMDAGAASSGQLGIGLSAASPTATSAW